MQVIQDWACFTSVCGEEYVTVYYKTRSVYISIGLTYSASTWLNRIQTFIGNQIVRCNEIKRTFDGR